MEETLMPTSTTLHHANLQKNLCAVPTPLWLLPPFQPPLLPLPQGSAFTLTRDLPLPPLPKVGFLSLRMRRGFNAGLSVPPWGKV
jgi:hypothetical protein